VDLSQAIAGITAICALVVPCLAMLAVAARRIGAIEPRIPSGRIGGAVVLCAALGGLARSAPVVAAIAPITSRAAPTATPTSPEPQPRLDGPYVVKPGDSLWAIACRHLLAGEASTEDASVDRMWRAIYAANRQVIGEDPDLIYPGTQLTIPEESV